MIYGLPEQGDFEGPGIDEPLALVHDMVRRPVDLRTAGMGHHAVRAELVAAASDTDISRAAPGVLTRELEAARKVKRLKVVFRGGEGGGAAGLVAGERNTIAAGGGDRGPTRGWGGGCEPIGARGRDGARGLGCVPFRGLRRSTRVIDQLRQAVELGWAAQKVNLRVPTHHVDPVALCHASDHAQNQALPGLLALANDPDAAVRLLLGLLPHGTGVVEHDLGILWPVDELVPEARELAMHELAVELVHLAAECLEVHPHCDRSG